MGVRLMHDAVQVDRGFTRQLVKFYPAGTGAVTSPAGKGATPARTGVGTYTVTFADNNGLTFIGARADYNADNAATNTIEADTGEYAANVLTVYTRTRSTGAAVDVTADGDRFVLVEVVWKRDSVSDGGGF